MKSRGNLKKKPTNRKALIAWATTLGMDELGCIHGGQCTCGQCCIWGSATKPAGGTPQNPKGPLVCGDSKAPAQGQRPKW